MTRPRRKSLATQALQLPNLITYARVLAIPAVLMMMQYDSPRNAFIAAMIFAVASATDALDGYLARRFNQTSLIGKFLDPLADKLIVMGALLMLIHLGRVSPWIALLILSREIIVTGLRTIAAGEGLVIRRARSRQAEDGLPDGRHLGPPRALPLRHPGPVPGPRKLSPGWARGFCISRCCSRSSPRPSTSWRSCARWRRTTDERPRRRRPRRLPRPPRRRPRAPHPRRPCVPSRELPLDIRTGLRNVARPTRE